MATDTGTTTASGKVVDLPRWAAPAEVAAAYGVSSRTLRLWASKGKVERRGSGRTTRYRMPSTSRKTETAAGMPDTARAQVPAVPRQAETQVPASSPADVSAELAYLRAALVDAERRAAVAEYRAELAESVDVDALRADLERVTAERDAARDRVRELRTGTIARLARRVTELTR